jgi:hypothetical protein
MLQVFYLDVAKVDLDVAYVCNGYTCVLGVCKCFRCMLQVFQTYVASVSAVSDVPCKCFIWMLEK